MSTPDALDQWVDRFMRGDLHDDPAPVREQGGFGASDLGEVWSEFVAANPEAAAMADKIGLVHRSVQGFGPATSREDARRQLEGAYAQAIALQDLAERQAAAAAERARSLYEVDDDLEGALDALAESGVAPGHPKFAEFVEPLYGLEAQRAQEWLAERADAAAYLAERQAQEQAESAQAEAVAEAQTLGRKAAEILSSFEERNPGLLHRLDETTGLGGELVELAARPEVLKSVLGQGERLIEEQDRVSTFELAVDKMLNDSEIAPGDHAVRSGYAEPQAHDPGISVDERYIRTGTRSDERDPLAGMSEADVDEFVSGIMDGALGPQSSEIQAGAMRAEAFARESALHEIEHGYPLTGWRDPADKVAEGPPSD